MNYLVRKPDAGKPHVRFDERGVEVVLAALKAHGLFRGRHLGIEVYLKMLMVGFFENLRSERAMAARCEDSLRPPLPTSLFPQPPFEPPRLNLLKTLSVHAGATTICTAAIPPV